VEWIDKDELLPTPNEEIIIFYLQWVYMGYLTDEKNKRWILYDHTDYPSVLEDTIKFIDFNDIDFWMPKPLSPRD
jgi:hypothetical protein